MLRTDMAAGIMQKDFAAFARTGRRLTRALASFIMLARIIWRSSPRVKRCICESGGRIYAAIQELQKRHLINYRDSLPFFLICL